MLHEELAHFSDLLEQATSPSDVFPSLLVPNRNTEERLAHLEEEYIQFMQDLNPDRFFGNTQAQNAARHLLSKLYVWHQRAEQRVRAEEQAPDQTPGPPFETRLRSVHPPLPNDATEFTIATPSGTFRADRFLAQGDVAMLYRGRCIAGSQSDVEVVLKIAMDKRDNTLIAQEVQFLRTLRYAEGQQTKHFPEVIAEFCTPNGVAGSILSYLPGHDFEGLRKRFPDGISAEHGVWILARALSALGFAHKQGIIHGNIDPAHLIVSPPDHNLFVIDWTSAVIAPEKTGQGFRVHNPDYSPPEVLERKPPLPASDLYSLGKAMIYLLGGDVQQITLPSSVDERMVRFLQFLCRQSPRQRAQDAWETARQLSELRTEVFGPPRFLPLEM